MSFADLSSAATVSRVLWVNASCCRTAFTNIVADAYGEPGVTPCWFGNGTTGPNLAINFQGSCVHPGNSANAVVDQEWNQYGNNVFNLYMEMGGRGTHSDTTTPWVSVQAFGTPTAADIFSGVIAGGDIASSTRYTFDLASGTHAIITGGQQGGISINAVNDHNANGGTKVFPINSSWSYSTEANLSAAQCEISQKSETAADSNVLTCARISQSGSYRIRFVMSVSAASSATLGWSATWTDSNGNAQAPRNLALVQSGRAAPGLTFTTSAAGNYYGYADVDVNSAGTDIVVKLTFSGTSFTAKVSASVEKLI
jgi:hypothetical protein